MTIETFIKKRPFLTWSTPASARLSESTIVEAVLEYGDFKDVKTLCSLLGIQKVAAIFRAQLRKRRVNYTPRTINYFQLYFNKYAKG